MSKRELEALLKDQEGLNLTSGSRSGRSRKIAMAEEAQLETEVARLKEELAAARLEVDKSKEENTRLQGEVARITAECEKELSQLDKHREEARMMAELEGLRAREKLRQEHQEVLKREQKQVDLERERAQNQVRVLTAEFTSKRAELEKRISDLEAELKSGSVARGGVAETDRVSTRVDGGGAGSSEGVPELEGSGEHDLTTETPPSDDDHDKTGVEGEHATLVGTMTKILQAHTKAIAAQTQAAAAQLLPPLKPYTG